MLKASKGGTENGCGHVEGGHVSVGVCRGVGGVRRWNHCVGAELMLILTCALLLLCQPGGWPDFGPCTATAARGHRPVRNLVSLPHHLTGSALSTSDTCFKLCQGHEGESWKDIPSSAFGLPSPTLPLLKSLHIYHSVNEKNGWSLNFHPLAWEKRKCCTGL